MIKKILTWAVFGFLIYAVLTSPDKAADIVRLAWDIVSQGFVNVERFFYRLING